MSHDKRKIADLIEREYVNGCRTLKSLAKEIGCSQPYLTLIGKECVEGYDEATKRRQSLIGNKFVCLHCGKSNA